MQKYKVDIIGFRRKIYLIINNRKLKTKIMINYVKKEKVYYMIRKKIRKTIYQEN